MSTPIRRTGLGAPEPDIGKGDRAGNQAVGRRSIVEDEGALGDWDPEVLPDARPSKEPAPHPRSESKTDRGWG